MSMTDDSTPTYHLADLQAKVRTSHYAITRAAADGARAMGMDEGDIVGCILALTLAEFHKTMRSETIPGAFQDVYKTVWCGVSVYAKLSLGLPARKAVVVSFKRDQSPLPGESGP